MGSIQVFSGLFQPWRRPQGKPEKMALGKESPSQLLCCLLQWENANQVISAFVDNFR